MPRNRIIKPEFWEDEKISKLTMTERLLFIAIWNFADDEGYLPCKKNWLKIKVFPYDSDINSEEIKNMVEKLKKYNFVNSKNGILWIKSFLKHQKIDRPRPSELKPSYLGKPTSVVSKLKAATSSRSLSRRNKEESFSESFELLWREYPRKDGKKDALKFFISTVITEEDFNDIQKALNNYKKYIEVTNTKTKYIKAGKTWFGNWKDWVDVDITPIEKENKTKEEKTDDILRDFAMGDRGSTEEESFGSIQMPSGDVSIEESDRVYDAVVVRDDKG